MDNDKRKTVLRQFTSLLPFQKKVRTVFDHYIKKLTVAKAITLFTIAQLNHWSSYKEIATQLRAQTELQERVGLTSISESQLSRSLESMPTELLEALFQRLALRKKRQTATHKGITPAIGKLSIVDASSITLPLRLCDWAQVTKKTSSVKMHLRLVAASPDTVFPDAMMPTTGNVGDRACSVDLVVPSDTTYVMDRGYDDYARMDRWCRDGIKFVMRMRERTTTTILEEFPVPKNGRIIRDAIVKVGSKSKSMEQTVRLIEFTDDQGRLYRLVTSVLDLSAEDIAQIYKSRWLVELFFKWIKQHLTVVHMHSHAPQAIWNQLFLVLITALLMDEMKAVMPGKQTLWQCLQQVRVYLYLPWSSLEQEILRKRRPSKGRKAGGNPRPKPLHTTVGQFKPSKKTKAK